MKHLIEGTLFIAFLLVAILGTGVAEAGGSVFVTLLAIGAVVALMDKAGMLAAPVSKEEYKKFYGRKM